MSGVVIVRAHGSEILASDNHVEIIEVREDRENLIKTIRMPSYETKLRSKILLLCSDFRWSV